MQGKLIVLYGINNIGKSTQAHKLVEKLQASGKKSEYLKYPIYNLEPAGPMINGYLREGNPYNLTPREAQLIYILDRTIYQSELVHKLEHGSWIIAEDYVGTGLAWGIGAGVDETFLKTMNSHLLEVDLAFFMQGNRFRDAEESNHAHEGNDDLAQKVEKVHERLAKEYEWIDVDATKTIDEVHESIWKHVKELL